MGGAQESARGGGEGRGERGQAEEHAGEAAGSGQRRRLRVQVGPPDERGRQEEEDQAGPSGGRGGRARRRRGQRAQEAGGGGRLGACRLCSPAPSRDTCRPSRLLRAQTSPTLPPARSRWKRPTGCEPRWAWHRFDSRAFGSPRALHMSPRGNGGPWAPWLPARACPKLSRVRVILLCRFVTAAVWCAPF